MIFSHDNDNWQLNSNTNRVVFLAWYSVKPVTVSSLLSDSDLLVLIIQPLSDNEQQLLLFDSYAETH